MSEPGSGPVNKNPMDKALGRVGVVALALVLALLVNINYVQGGQAEKLQSHKFNFRQHAEVFNKERGAILAGRQVLASSKETGKSQPKYTRDYKDGEIFVPVTGFFSSNGGKTGLELAYATMLEGDDTRLTAKRWFDAFIGKPKVGANVETSIDPQAQRLAYNQLAQSTDRRAAAAVMDIESGAIKVLASYPSFDPNKIAPQTGEKGAQRVEQLNDADFQPMVNKALHETFPPGSSFKTLVAAAALEEGISKDTVVAAPSSYTLPGTNTPLPNSFDSPGGCGSDIALILTFKNSCNTTYAILAAERLGKQKIIDKSKEFGFEQRIEVEPDLLTAPSSFPDLTPNETALGGIGQGNTTATPLQMAMLAAAPANDGQLMKPYLVERVRATDESTLYEADPEKFSEPMSEDEASQLQDMMRAVVEGGSLSGYPMAGKTGTAETKRGFNNRWFIGFAPADDPKYAFAVATEGAGSGGQNAGPIAGKIVQAVLSNDD